MQNSKNNLYDTDYQQWAEQQKQLLQSGQLDRLDIKNLLEELGEIVKNNRRSLVTQLKRLVTHLLKYQYQMTVINPQRHDPQSFRSWTDTISNARVEIGDILNDSPSLHPQAETLITSAYPQAKNNAIREMNRYLPDPQHLDHRSFPPSCPWSFEQMIQDDWLP